MLNDDDDKPTMSSVLDYAIAGALDGVRVALPARVVTYDAGKQRADVQPLIGEASEGEDGERVFESLPQINDVPVAFQGAGGYAQTFPLEPGDTVLLVFCSSSISTWKVLGASGESVVDPKDNRHHVLADAIAFAGVRDFAHALTGVPSDAWVITTPAGKQIRLGSAAADQSTLKAETFLDAMSALLEGIRVGFAAVPGSGSTIASAFEGVITAFENLASTYKTTKVKVE